MRWVKTLAFVFVSCGVLLQAQAASLSFSIDNDLFLGLDKHYTNGLRLAYLSDTQTGTASQCGLYAIFCHLPGLSGNQHQAWSVAVQQMMITPKDIRQTEQNFDDLPYVGFTHLDVGVYGWNEKRLTGYGLRLGVVGDLSGAEASQKFIHKFIGSKQPKGWKHQLGNDVIAGLYAFQSLQLIDYQTANQYRTTLHYLYGIDANNYLGAVRTGALVQWGRKLHPMFIPDFTGLSTGGAMIGAYDNSSRTSWSLFGGLFGEYDAYSYLVDRAPSTYQLDEKRWVANVIIGTGHRWHRLHAFFTLRTGTSLLENRHVDLTFGNVTLLWQL